MRAPIPTTPADITADWLTQTLRATNALNSASVASVTLTRIGEDEGFSGGGLYLARLTYDHADPHVPASLVVKLSPVDPAMRAIARAANGREVGFYGKLVDGIKLPVPFCYYADFDDETAASILLLQDLGGHRSVPFLQGCGPADAKRVVESLAEIHATWWNSPALDTLTGAHFFDEYQFATLWPRYQDSLKSLLQDIDLPPSFLALGNHIAQNEVAVFKGLLETAPLSCLHRDIQADNVMFAPTKAGGRAVLLDWQLAGKGRGAYDVCYFLISSVEPTQRRNLERGLVAHYHAELLRAGIRGYSLRQCWTDYLKSVAGKLYITVVATVLLDNSSPHKKAWRRADLTRLLAFCADHRISAQTFRL